MPVKIHFLGPKDTPEPAGALNKMHEDKILISEDAYDQLISDRHSSRVGLTCFAVIYLGIGMWAHAAFYGPLLEVNDAWTWAYLLVWPLLLLFSIGIWLGKILIILGPFILGVSLIYWAFKGLKTWWSRR